MTEYRKTLDAFIKALPEENKNVQLFKYIEEREEISCARYVPHRMRGCKYHHAGRCGVIMTGCSHNKKFGGYANE